MGQAKIRGSFEQRQAEGIARLAKEEAERERLQQARQAKEAKRRADLAVSDPEAYEREKADRMRLPSMVAMLAGMLVSSR